MKNKKFSKSLKFAFSRTLVLLFLLNFSLFAKSHKITDKKLNIGNNSINFLVLSDWGREGITDKSKKAPGQVKVAKQLAKTAAEIKASFLVTCGDNFHGKGVQTATDPFWKVNFENVYNAKSLMFPWYITLGNHDYEGNVDAELEYAKKSKRWIQPARYYAFEKKIDNSTTALFLNLDSTPFIEQYRRKKNDNHNVGGQDTAKQLNWADSVLKATNAKWKFVFFHHPIYSAGSKHGSTKELQRTILPILKKYKVDVCFSGHDHDLQHSHPKNSTIEFLGLGGGSEVRKVGMENFTKFSASSLGFGLVSLSKNIFKFSFINDKGKKLYGFELKK